ncbi:DUF1648 domain-containing protein [Acidobacteriota bacterium]
MKNKSICILFIFNCILIASGWILAFYSYPRLPQRMPLWLNLYGQTVMVMEKSLLFFIYPLTQTLFGLSFFLVSKSLASRIKTTWKAELLVDQVLLNLIFFNLIFIHVQSSLVLLARHYREGVYSSYFFALIVVILLLIPYYRLRAKIIKR